MLVAASSLLGVLEDDLGEALIKGITYQKGNFPVDLLANYIFNTSLTCVSPKLAPIMNACMRYS